MKNKFKKFLERKKTAHKGDFGKTLIVAGSRGMSGAASLSAISALRSGAGLVTLAVPDSIYQITARRDPEMMVQPFPSTRAGSLDLKAFKKISLLAQNQDVLAIGPGLSRNHSTAKLIHRLILNSKIPVVIDADGLNALEGMPHILLEAKAPLILTPHEREFERVFGPLLTYAVSAKGGSASGGKGAQPRSLVREALRRKAAQEMAEKYAVFIVLKGSRTVVAAPDGRIFTNSTGNPGMATAGSGDVLTGIIAGLLGRGKDIFETVCLAVYAHGLAGDLAAKKTGQTSLIAHDILENLPFAFKKMGSN